MWGALAQWWLISWWSFVFGTKTCFTKSVQTLELFNTLLLVRVGSWRLYSAVNIILTYLFVMACILLSKILKLASLQTALIDHSSSWYQAIYGVCMTSVTRIWCIYGLFILCWNAMFSMDSQLIYCDRNNQFVCTQSGSFASTLTRQSWHYCIWLCDDLAHCKPVHCLTVKFHCRTSRWLYVFCCELCFMTQQTKPLNKTTHYLMAWVQTLQIIVIC